MKIDSKRIVATASAVVIASIFFWTFAQARKHATKKPEPKVVPIQSQISVQNGETIVTMRSQEEKLAGIATAPLKKASAREQITAPATVLSVQGLAKLRARYIAAAAQLAKARAMEDVSAKEYARLKSLYQNNRNISQKALQAAEGALHSDETDVHAAQQELALEGLRVRQNWGGVVERWVKNDDPMLERVLGQRVLLVEVTVPPDKSAASPSTVQLEMPGGKRGEGSLVSPFPRVDPRIQEVSFLYRTAATVGLEPGLNLIAHLAVGRLEAGVVIPASAVVWWQGKAWVYIETAPGEFTRQAVAANHSVSGGFFVAGTLAPREKLVTRGAEQLLAVESSSGP